MKVSRQVRTMGLLDWPHYTRPEFAGRRVPAGAVVQRPAAIARWRRKRARWKPTWVRRRELLDGVELDAESAELLREFLQEQEIKS